MTANCNVLDAAVTYQWKSADTEDGTYTNITNATNKTYSPAAAKEGKYIKVEVKGTGTYSGTALSAAVGPVAEADTTE